MAPSDDGIPAPSDLAAGIEAAERRVGDSFDDAWIGLEPTFQTRQCVELFTELEDEEDKYFAHAHMIDTVRTVGGAMAERYREAKRAGESWALFDGVEEESSKDDWGLTTHALTFALAGAPEPFVVTFGMDPATFELSLRPLPLAWLYDERFAAFLDAIVFRVPEARGLSTSLANGGGQFHISAKTMLTGSLLCDDLVTRLSHPELSTWVCDFPNCDGRSFRATDQRFAAFIDVIERYRAGGYHPRACGVPTVETAYFDLWPSAAAGDTRGLMDEMAGPRGDERAEFQTNFAFGRAVKERAQRIHAGYWQAQHPQDDGYRPDQIMRYSETNLARLQIIGELHVKKDEPLPAPPEEVHASNGAFPLEAPLEPRMLFPGASYELRAQMSKKSALDTIDAVLLEVHHWRWLRRHPHPSVRRTLLQDQLLKDAAHTVRARRGDAALDELRVAARAYNAKLSGGRVCSDFIEPETLFWTAWQALPQGEQAAIAREVVLGFTEYVGNAAVCDPRRADPAVAAEDPMEPHRHRVHPLLWEALANDAECRRPTDVVGRELRAYQAGRERYHERRPQWSQVDGEVPPWG